MIKNKKGQGALEFLMTYGWAFLVIIVMIGALVYLDVLDPTRFTPDSMKAEQICENNNGKFDKYDRELDVVTCIKTEKKVMNSPSNKTKIIYVISDEEKEEDSSTPIQRIMDNQEEMQSSIDEILIILNDNNTGEING